MLSKYILKNLPFRLRQGLDNAKDRTVGRLRMKADLSVIVIRKDGKQEDFGVVSTRVVTDAFVNYLVDSMQDSSTYPMDVFKYHACGTGTASEAASDTALGAEVESRTSGTLTEGGSPNKFQTVGTITMTGSHSITEHGIFSASSAGTLLDRSVFSAINVASGDSIQFTYTLTVNSGQ